MGASWSNPQAAYGVSGAASGFGANPGYGRQAPTIGGQTDPQSQALLQAMKSLGQQPQGKVTGLASNLLADALLQYSLKQRQQQQERQNLAPTPMDLIPMQLGARLAPRPSGAGSLLRGRPRRAGSSSRDAAPVRASGTSGKLTRDSPSCSDTMAG